MAAPSSGCEIVAATCFWCLALTLLLTNPVLATMSISLLDLSDKVVVFSAGCKMGCTG